MTFHSTGLLDRLDRTKSRHQKKRLILKSLHAYPRIKLCYSFFSLQQPANRKFHPLSPQEFQPLLGHLTCQDHTKLRAILESPTRNPQKRGDYENLAHLSRQKIWLIFRVRSKRSGESDFDEHKKCRRKQTWNFHIFLGAFFQNCEWCVREKNPS